ncbi:MAG: hypothetical protein ABFQ64_05845 [Campylobacterota bacterium]
MFIKFDEKIKTIFLDPNSSEDMVDERVNVILSPSLYWVKKITLPIKSVAGAKKLLPSIFEDTLPKGNYNYFVYKEKNVFFAFAYEDKVILDLLSEKGISDSNVKNVYFAQSELSFIDGTVTINKTQKICLKDGVLILLCEWIEDIHEIDLDDIELSKNYITLAQFGHIVDNNSLYTIWLILIMLIALVFTEYFITSHKLQELTALNDNIFKKHNLQETSIQNETVLKEYTLAHSKQTLLREYIAIVLSLKLKSGENLKQMTLKNRVLSLEFTALCDETVKSITHIMESNRVKFKTEKKVNSWHLEMIL